MRGMKDKAPPGVVLPTPRRAHLAVAPRISFRGPFSAHPVLLSSKLATCRGAANRNETSLVSLTSQCVMRIGYHHRAQNSPVCVCPHEAHQASLCSSGRTEVCSPRVGERYCNLHLTNIFVAEVATNPHWQPLPGMPTSPWMSCPDGVVWKPY